MNLVDRLKASHSFIGDPLHREAYEEIEELVSALKHLVHWHDQLSMADIDKAKKAIAKATGDE
jgi:hypothetical protein